MSSMVVNFNLLLSKQNGFHTRNAGGAVAKDKVSAGQPKVKDEEPVGTHGSSVPRLFQRGSWKFCQSSKPATICNQQTEGLQ